MTTDDLAAIEARARRASTGPWLAQTELRDGWPVCSTGYCDEDDLDWGVNTEPMHGDQLGGGSARQNAEFVAACRTDVPALIAEVRRLLAVEARRKAADNSLRLIGEAPAPGLPLFGGG